MPEGRDGKGGTDGRTGNPEGPRRGDGGHHRDLQGDAGDQLSHLSRLCGAGPLRARLVRGSRLADVERRSPDGRPARRAQGGGSPAARNLGGPCRRHPAVSARRAPDGHAEDGGQLSRHDGDRLGRGARGGGSQPVARSLRQDPDHDRDRLPVPEGRGAHRAPGRSPHGRELLQHVLRRGAAAGGDRRLRYLDDPLRRAQLQRVHLHRADHRLEPVGHLFGGHRRHRLAQGPASRRRQRSGDAHVP